MVTSAEHRVKHCAGQLAAATYTANNYLERYVDDKGLTKTRTKRDSQDFPRTGAKKLVPLKALKPKPAVAASATTTTLDSDSASEQPLTVTQRRRIARAVARKKQGGPTPHHQRQANQPEGGRAELAQITTEQNH